VTVSPSVLLLSIAIGVPLMLLALGVLYHAHLLANRQSSDLNAHVEQLVTNPDEVLQGLQQSMQQVRGDLTRQRAALRQMMSDTERAPVMAPEPAMVSGAPMMPIPVPEPTPMPPELPLDRTSGELRTAVSELAAEGLSDRAIARRLRIGLEEVRLARASTGHSRQI
jgi:hypothetical protein